MNLHQCKRGRKNSKKNEMCVFFTHNIVIFFIFAPENQTGK